MKDGPAVWTCMSHRPGMRYFPLPSTTRAPSGTLTSPDLPTAVIRSPVTTTVMSGRAGAPVESMTVTPVMASDFAGASSPRPGSEAGAGADDILNAAHAVHHCL